MSWLRLSWTVMQRFLSSWVDLMLSFVINVCKALTRQPDLWHYKKSLSFNVLFLWPGQSPMNGFLWWRQNKSSSLRGTLLPLFLQQKLFIETKIQGQTREVVAPFLRCLYCWFPPLDTLISDFTATQQCDQTIFTPCFSTLEFSPTWPLWTDFFKHDSYHVCTDGTACPATVVLTQPSEEVVWG